MMGNWVRPVGIHCFLILAGCYSVFAVQFKNLAQDPGLGWHLRTGSWILRERALLFNDPFLAGTAERLWIADQWLADVLLAGLYQFGSWELLTAVVAAAYLLFYFVFCYQRIACFTGSWLAASVAVVLAFKLAQVHLIVRPVIFNFFLFACVLWWGLGLYRRLRVDATAYLFKSPMEVVLFGLGFVLWANLHPGFVIGVFVIGAIPLALAIDWICWRGSALSNVERRRLKQLVLLALVALALTGLNPNGFRLHASILWLTQSTFAMNYYAEWQSPDLHGFIGKLFFVPIVIIVGGLLARRSQVLNWGSYEALLLLVFGWYALQAVRFMPFWGIVTAVPVAEALQSLGAVAGWQATGRARRLRRAIAWLEERESRANRGMILITILMAAVVVGVLATGRVPLYQGFAGPAKHKYPYGAVAKLNELALQAEQELVVANYLDWGGFVIGLAAPRVKPLIDDRTALHGEAPYQAYLQGLASAGDWSAYLCHNRAEFVLWPSSGALHDSMRACPELELLYEDALASLFRTGPGLRGHCS